MRALPLVLFALSACAAKPLEPPHEAVPPEVPPERPAPPVPAEALRCGGIAGLRCPLPMVCVDEPDDSCVPGRGADCIGRCVAPEEAPRRPGLRRPVRDDPAECKGLRIRCEAGDVPYSDASGCGCETAGTQRL
jgi:hypothetical protein